MIVGRKSTLFLAYGYQFEAGKQGGLVREASWKSHPIKGTALLPHLDEYVRKGELLRAYDVAGDLRAAFGSNQPWVLAGEDETLEVTITDPPRVYALDTGYAFIVIGVAPHPSETLTLARLEDAAYAICAGATA